MSKSTTEDMSQSELSTFCAAPLSIDLGRLYGAALSLDWDLRARDGLTSAALIDIIFSMFSRRFETESERGLASAFAIKLPVHALMSGDNLAFGLSL